MDNNEPNEESNEGSGEALNAESLIGDLSSVYQKPNKKQRQVTRGLTRQGLLKPEAPARERPTKPLEIILTKRGMMIELADLLELLTMDRYSQLQERLTLVYSTKVGKKVMGRLTMRLFKIITIMNGDKVRRIFSCSRFCGIKSLLSELCTRYTLNIRIRNQIAEGQDIPDVRNVCKIQLTENQQHVVDYLMTQIYSPARRARGSSGCVFVMGTGEGKSFVISWILHKLSKKTLIVIPSQSIMDGWYQLLNQYFPFLRIGQYFGRIKTDGDVVLGVINSVLSDEFNFGTARLNWSDYLNQFGLVVYDEIHNYPTDGRQEIFWRAGARCLMGVTATPDERIDGMDVVYTKHIGPLVYAPKIPGYDVADILWKGKVKVIEYRGPKEHTQRIVGYNGTTNVTGMHKQFCGDPYRNRLILNEILRLQAAGKDVFCFSEHREYLEYIYSLLQVYGIRAAAPEFAGRGTVTRLVGGSTSEDHARAKKAQILLVTYAYAKEGISIVKMSAIIFMTPRRRKMRQILGRILRRGGDPSVEREIVDIVDVATPLKSQYPDRKGVYDEKGFPVEISRISWEEIEDPLTRA